jgi:hypothetical protein
MIFRGLGEGRPPLGVGKEEAYMHWYNPKEGKVEDVKGPSTDEEALEMLSGHPNSGRFVERYVVLREEGLGVEQALVFVGHSLRMHHLRHLNLGRVREFQRTP